MATFEEAFDVVSNTFRIPKLKCAAKKTGIGKIVEKRKDAFVNIPTAFYSHHGDGRKENVFNRKI